MAKNGVGSSSSSSHEPERVQREIENGVRFCCSFKDVPGDVLHNIFVHLPVKDVMRCKCVCTEWRKVISEPLFSEIYARKSPYISLLHCVDPRTIDERSQLFYLLEVSDRGECIKSPINPVIPGWEQKRTSLFVAGSCNGLLCLRAHQPGVDVIYVGNPIMGRFIALPEIVVDIARRIVFYKIGFSSSSNHYKVLKFGFTTMVADTVEEAEIFTVGVDEKWRRLTDIFPKLSFWTELVAFNGAFHWVPCDEGPARICTLDVGEERLGRVPLPSDSELDPKQTNLAVFNNQLSIVVNGVPSEITIWIMKDYPNMDSWTKFVIQKSWIPASLRFNRFVPVAGLRNGDILFTCSPSYFMASYNIKQRRCSTIEVHGVGRLSASSMITHGLSFSMQVDTIIRGLQSTANIQP